MLDYNQDAHRQRTINWIDSTGGIGTAFDFTTKGILQEACRDGSYWRLVDHRNKPAGVLGHWPARAPRSRRLVAASEKGPGRFAQMENEQRLQRERVRDGAERVNIDPRASQSG